MKYKPKMRSMKNQSYNHTLIFSKQIRVKVLTIDKIYNNSSCIINSRIQKPKANTDVVHKYIVYFPQKIRGSCYELILRKRKTLKIF